MLSELDAYKKRASKSRIYIINKHTREIHILGERRNDTLTIDESRQLVYKSSTQRGEKDNSDRFDILVSVNGELLDENGKAYDELYGKWIEKYVAKQKEFEELKSYRNDFGREVIRYLNGMLDTHYVYTRKVASLINARIEEGATMDDFLTVINIKIREWKDTEYRKYLRPETLFGTKFQSYRNQLPAGEVDPFVEIWKKL